MTTQLQMKIDLLGACQNADSLALTLNLWEWALGQAVPARASEHAFGVFA